ncbi:6-carboxytetrahydropterin synthase QueD [Heliorestis convoluta]|uniref:6-carboxy-5,6,7,8-tetrahydropterin synthase n=1 Tax=Heliorestis convoluta TaxID=356322 RepID=A0A5Q2N6T7_9FIRM|nr:6-carboxytetrahydropterin synthase QueD [Heliorestis convoluta]QGG49336.1 queuosine biosynthesis protein QueD [Heliorestis convoluta]
MYELIVQSHFDAAHYLRDYPGKCAQVHGHSWDVEVVLQGEQLDNLGMLVDFGIVKAELNRICDQLDHKMINEHSYFQEHNPTAENLARFFHEQLTEWVKTRYSHIIVASVEVWESPRASIRYKAI